MPSLALISSPFVPSSYIAVVFERPREDRFIITVLMFVSDTFTVRKVYDDEVALRSGFNVVPVVIICGALPSTPVVMLVEFSVLFRSVVFMYHVYIVSSVIVGDVALNQILIEVVVFCEVLHFTVVADVFVQFHEWYPDEFIVESLRLKVAGILIVVIFMDSFA